MVAALALRNALLLKGKEGARGIVELRVKERQSPYRLHLAGGYLVKVDGHTPLWRFGRLPKVEPDEALARYYLAFGGDQGELVLAVTRQAGQGLGAALQATCKALRGSVIWVPSPGSFWEELGGGVRMAEEVLALFPECPKRR